MRTLLKAAALSVVALVIVIETICSAQAQIKQPPVQAAPQKQFFPVKQMPLTAKLLEGYLAATDEIDEITQNTPEDIDKLSPATIAKLDAVAKKHDLGSYDQYLRVA